MCVFRILKAMISIIRFPVFLENSKLTRYEYINLYWFMCCMMNILCMSKETWNLNWTLCFTFFHRLNQFWLSLFRNPRWPDPIAPLDNPFWTIICMNTSVFDTKFLHIQIKFTSIDSLLYSSIVIWLINVDGSRVKIVLLDWSRLQLVYSACELWYIEPYSGRKGNRIIRWYAVSYGHKLNFLLS